MKTLIQSELAPLRFTPRSEPQKIKAQSAKIAWIESLADKPGASFDIVIKDGLGRVRMEKKNCTTETEKYGEMINFPTLVGEDLEISVENLKGADHLDLFLN